MIDPTNAFSSFAVDDLGAAAAFYRDTLGIEVTEDAMGVLFLNAGGGRVLVYPKPDHVPAAYTVLNFPVDDIEATADDLAAKGVAFTRYDGFDHDAKGIVRDPQGPPIAWFTDPAGNVLSVLESGSV